MPELVAGVVVEPAPNENGLLVVVVEVGAGVEVRLKGVLVVVEAAAGWAADVVVVLESPKGLAVPKPVLGLAPKLKPVEIGLVVAAGVGLADVAVLEKPNRPPPGALVVAAVPEPGVDVVAEVVDVLPKPNRGLFVVLDWPNRLVLGALVVVVPRVDEEPNEKGVVDGCWDPVPLLEPKLNGLVIVSGFK